MNEVLVFDLDDTLYPEADFVFSGFKTVNAWVLDRFGVEGFAKHARTKFEAGHRGRIFNSVMAKMDLPDNEKLIDEMVDIYRNHCPKISLYPDARWALEYFPPRVSLGLISDGYLCTQENKLEALGIRQRFAKIVLTDSLGRDFWKPSPKPYQEIERAFGPEPICCTYIADNPLKDFIAPRLLGWQTIRVVRKNGLYSGQTVEQDQDAERLITSLRDLPQAAL